MNKIFQWLKSWSDRRGGPVSPQPKKESTQFEISVALLWKNILNAERAETFAGDVTATIDRWHGFDRLPQPGFVGSRYRPGGILLMGQNPGNDRFGQGMSFADKRQYELLQKLKDGDEEVAVASYHQLMETLSTRVMPTWPIIRKVVNPLLEGLKLELNHIVYTNIVKFRTINSGFKGSIYEKSWPLTLHQLNLLRPSVVIVLGVGAHKQFVRLYKGNADVFKIHRAIGDSRLPLEGQSDIKEIVRHLRPK